MNSAVTPMLVLGGVSYVNNWYNTGNVTDVKPLLYAGIAGLLLSGVASIPGWQPVAVTLGWTAVTAAFIAPVQKPSPLDNLLKITGGNAA